MIFTCTLIYTQRLKKQMQGRSESYIDTLTEKLNFLRDTTDLNRWTKYVSRSITIKDRVH